MKHIKEIIIKLNLINILSIFCYFFSLFKIKSNKIFCTNFSGKGYGDSPKYIVENLIKKNSKLDIVWAVAKTNYEFPPYIRTVKIYSLKYFYELMTSKIWINNSRFEQFIRKRKNQFYVQTWHANLGMKKIEYDAEDKLSTHYRKVMENDNKMIDLMLSNSDFSDQLYRRGFRYTGEIIKYGTPRNDILINNNFILFKQKIKKIYKIPKNSKIILYAPTFRNKYKKNPYDINFNNLVKSLEEKTQKKWTIIIKLHPRMKNTSKYINSKFKYYDALNYGDTQELIMACDLLITDYSSTMMEAMIANKPVICYANDISSYITERGFYMTFNDMPFQLATSNKELINIINNSCKNLSNLTKDYHDFKEKVGLKETGISSNKVSEIILEKMEV